jgi:hypothetical protein
MTEYIWMIGASGWLFKEEMIRQLDVKFLEAMCVFYSQMMKV